MLKGCERLCFFAAASLTVISVKAVSGMITESIKGQLQLIYPIFYIMLVVMIASCAFQIKLVKFFFSLFAFFFKLFPYLPFATIPCAQRKPDSILAVLLPEEMVTFCLLSSTTVLMHEYAAAYTILYISLIFFSPVFTDFSIRR